MKYITVNGGDNLSKINWSEDLKILFTMPL